MEVEFNCPLCAQPLEAEEGVAGFRLQCPHCGGQIIVPKEVGAESAPDSSSQEQIAALDSDLEAKRQEIESAHRELSQTKSVLIETLQQLRAARNGMEKLRAEADATEKSNASLRSRAHAVEEMRGKFQGRLQDAELQRGALLKQLEATKSQRSAYLWETKRLEAALLEANSRISRLAEDNEERGRSLDRALHVSESLRAECAWLKQELESKAKRVASTLAELELSQQGWKHSEEDREKLQAQLLASQDAESLTAAENRIADLHRSAGDMAIKNFRLREKFEEATQERSALKSENADLRIQLAAVREALNSTELHQENELLRGVIERTNEQIRALTKSSISERFEALNEPFESEPQRGPAGLRWVQSLFARWGHPV